MGGGQAVTIGLQNLDKFSAIGSFSGAVPRNGSERIERLLSDSKSVDDALDLFWIGCGRDDFLLERNEAFAKTLREYGIEHEFHLTEGVHNYDVWRRYFAAFAPRLFAATVPPPGTTGNADNVPFVGGRDSRGNPVRLARKTGHVSNYDESKVTEYSLPDPLKTSHGERVTTAEGWQTGNSFSSLPSATGSAPDPAAEGGEADQPLFARLDRDQSQAVTADDLD